MTWDEVWSDPRHWLPDLVAGLVVLVIGVFEAATTDYVVHSRIDLLWVAVPTALAVGLSRRLPSAALALVWLTCGLQVFTTTQILYMQLFIAIVAFGTARWGSTLTVVLSALSVPLAGLLAINVATSDMFAIVVNVARYRRVIDAVHQLGGTWQVGSALLGMALLGLPWLAGLTVRFSRRAAESEASATAAHQEAERANVETEQAREIARLQEEQAQLARDVHDVVGHSLAVILAQAESAQFLDEADTERLRLSMRNIADSARSSLRDVRHVLMASPETTGPGELHELVEGVRASGHELKFEEAGSARPLPPELGTVAYRVLQEMLTNAIRHGARESAAGVELHWGGDELRIEVANVVGAGASDVEGTPDDQGGHGIEGMRRRLESVGGRLDVRRRHSDDQETFTATAWVPMRAVTA